MTVSPRIKTEIITELKDTKFWLYTLSLLILSTILYFDVKFNFLHYKTIKIIEIMLFPFVQSLYNIHVQQKDKKNYFGWIISGLFVTIAVIYIAILSSEIQIAAVLLLGIIFACIIIELTAQFGNLWRSKRILDNKKRIILIVFNYLLLAFIIILLFAMIYLLTPSIVNQDNQRITSLENYVYFSLSTFYSDVIGYTPTGFSKIIFQIETITSYILHIILLGYILSERPRNRQTK